MYTIALGALVVAFLESALRLTGHGPLPPDGAYLNQRFEPDTYSRPDSLLGYALNPGHFRITYNDSLRWSATHLADGSRTCGRGESSDSMVMMYGCSNVYGIGLDDSLTIAWRLQQRLPNRGVVNFGIGGGSTVRAMLLLERHLGAGMRPSVVMVSHASHFNGRNTMSRWWRKVLYPNVRRYDAVDSVLIPYAVARGEGIEVRRRSVRFCQVPLAGHSALMASADRALTNIDLMFLRPQTVAERLLLRMSGMCVEVGARFIVLMMTDDSDTRALAARLDAAGVEYVYLCPPDDGGKYDLMPYDPHPNAAATAIYTDIIYQRIEGRP